MPSMMKLMPIMIKPAVEAGQPLHGRLPGDGIIVPTLPEDLEGVLEGGATLAVDVVKGGLDELAGGNACDLGQGLHDLDARHDLVELVGVDRGAGRRALANRNAVHCGGGLRCAARHSGAMRVAVLAPADIQNVHQRQAARITGTT